MTLLSHAVDDRTRQYMEGLSGNKYGIVAAGATKYIGELEVELERLRAELHRTRQDLQVSQHNLAGSQQNLRDAETRVESLEGHLRGQYGANR